MTNIDKNKLMYDFWKKHSTEANEDEMMLDSKGSYISQIEIPEIISLIPNFAGKDILELAAGIGRYTSVFAKQANKVVATDFMDNFVKRNIEINGHLPNVQIYQADATKMKCENNSYHLIFSNWLLMYLRDIDVVTLFEKAIRWLMPGGYFFFRESCFHKSGDKIGDSNPTIYRIPQQYLDAFSSIRFQENGREYYFKPVLSKYIETYIEIKSDINQICWLLCKEELDIPINHERKSLFPLSFNEDIDSNLPGSDADHFMASSDCVFYKDLFSNLDIQCNSKVLDVGCAAGKSTFHISKIYGADVIGLDNDFEQICHAQLRLYNLQVKGVQFMAQNYDALNFQNNVEFDFIFCNCILNILKSPISVIQKLMDHLKKDGQLLLLDLCLNCESNNDREFCAINNNQLFTQQHLQKILSPFKVVEIEYQDINENISNFFELKFDTSSSLVSNQNYNESMKKQLKLLMNKNMKYFCLIISK